MSPCRRFALIGASLAVLAPHAVRAQKDVASCKLVLDAVLMLVAEPDGQAAMVKQEQENIRDAKAYSCRRLRDESVGGVPAVVYSAHSETEDIKSDAQVWVARGTGLVVRTETDISMTDGSGTNRDSARYEYTNVQVPAGVT